MAKAQRSVRMDRTLVHKVQKVLRARDKTEAVERTLTTVLELAKDRRMIQRFSGTGKSDHFHAA